MISQQTVSGRVTAIVASYNHAEFLEERMESLVSQTYEDFEILVIDDKSPDNSPEILKKYENNERVRLYLETENRGWVGTSNLGAERATGEYIIFTNCDDSCEKEMISNLVSAIKSESGSVLAWSASLMTDENSKVIGSDRDYREPYFIETYGKGGAISQEEMKQMLFHSCIIPNLSALLIDKKTFIDVGGFDEAYSVVSDWDLFFKLCSYGGSFYIPENLNHFRQHGTTIRQKAKTIRLLEEYIRMLTGYSQTYLKDLQKPNQAVSNIASILANVIWSEPTIFSKITLLFKALNLLGKSNRSIGNMLQKMVFKKITGKFSPSRQAERSST